MMKLNLEIIKRMMLETLHKLLVFAIAVVIGNLFFMNPASGQTTMAHFGLNNNYNFDIDNVVGTPTASGNGLSFGSSSGTCEGSQYVFCTGSNDYLQIDINTTGYSSISISWQQKWSTTGTNRGNWNLLGDADNNGSYEYSSTVADVTANCFTVTISLPSSFDNKSLVHLRIQSNVTTGNYLLLDDVTISGCTPPAITGTLNTCVGNTTQLSGAGTPAASNPWLSATTSVATVNSAGLVMGVAAGTSVITYTDNNGCSNTATVTVNPSLTISGTLTVCAGSTTPLTGSGTPAGVNPWLSATTSVATVSNTGLVTGVAAGTSVITYTNNTGCNKTATVTVNAFPVSSVTGQTNITCYSANDGTITVTGSGGVSPYTFSIDNGANYLGPTGGSRLFTGLAPNTPFKIRVKDNIGCESKLVQ